MLRVSRIPTADRREQKVWPRVVERFRSYRWMLCGTALLVVISVGLNMVGPLLLQRIINEALPRHDTGLLIVLCTAMVISGALSNSAAVTLNTVSNWIGQQVVHGLRLEVYDQVQRMPLEFFANEPVAEIQACMASDIGGISDILTYTGTSTLTAAVSVAAAGLVMVILSWPLALFCFMLAVLLGMFNRRFAARRRDLAARRQEQMAMLLRLVDDDLTLSGIILGRTFLRYATQRSRFRATSKEVADLTYRQRAVGSIARGVIGLVTSGLPALIYLMAGTAIHGLSLGTAIVMVTLQMRLTGPIQQLLALNGRLQSSQAMFHRVFDYLDLEPALALGEAIPGQHARQDHHSISLRAHGIGHCYLQSRRPSLTDVDIELTPGSTTLITGPTGSGKTTLALILAGLVTPTSGAVETRRSPSVSAHRWQVATCRDLWQQVTLVAQETSMFNASIRDNLRFARPDATERQMLQVADAMQIGEFIASLPDGLDTMVGEHGYQLSGGERQRLALARALIGRSQFLIIDEATSALDGPTANAVHKALREACQGRELIMIAHRIPPMARDDQVFLLDQGCIVHRGTHGDLVSSCPEYQQLLAGQAPRTQTARSR